MYFFKYKLNSKFESPRTRMITELKGKKRISAGATFLRGVPRGQFSVFSSFSKKSLGLRTFLAIAPKVQRASNLNVKKYTVWLANPPPLSPERSKKYNRITQHDF